MQDTIRQVARLETTDLGPDVIFGRLGSESLKLTTARRRVLRDSSLRRGRHRGGTGQSPSRGRRRRGAQAHPRATMASIAARPARALARRAAAAPARRALRTTPVRRGGGGPPPPPFLRTKAPNYRLAEEHELVWDDGASAARRSRLFRGSPPPREGLSPLRGARRGRARQRRAGPAASPRERAPSAQRARHRRGREPDRRPRAGSEPPARNAPAGRRVAPPRRRFAVLRSL